MESRYREMLTSIETLEAELKKAEADNKLNIAILEAQLATSEAQLKIFSLDSLQMKFATELNQKLIELEMKKAVIEKQKTEKKAGSYKNDRRDRHKTEENKDNAGENERVDLLTRSMH